MPRKRRPLFLISIRRLYPPKSKFRVTLRPTCAASCSELFTLPARHSSQRKDQLASVPAKLLETRSRRIFDLSTLASPSFLSHFCLQNIISWIRWKDRYRYASNSTKVRLRRKGVTSNLFLESFDRYCFESFLDVSENERIDFNIKTVLMSGITCHARREIFCPKIEIFSQFQVYLSITQAEQMIWWYHNDKYKKKATNYCIIYGSVARYGPQSVASASG